MKIDSILFSCSAPFVPFWNIQAKIWKTRFGIEPICLFFGDKKSSSIDETYGKVYEIQPFSDLPPVLQITCAKFLACDLVKELDSSKTYLIGDVDTLPLQTEYFTKEIENIPDSDYLHLRAYDEFLETGSKADNLTKGGDLPGYYHVSKGSTFLNLFLKGSFRETVRYIAESNLYGIRVKVLNENIQGMGDIHDYYWCAEETYTSQQIWKAAKASQIVFHGRDYLLDSKQRYIDRDSVRCSNDCRGWNGVDYIYDKDKLSNGGYIDIHCMRPYALQFKAMMRILETARMV